MPDASQPQTKRRRGVVAVAAGLVALPMLLFLCPSEDALLRPTLENHTMTAPFDSARWKARALDGDLQWPTRLRMIDDLLRRQRLVGADRATVERLLGPPDDTPYFKDWSMVYWLGPERGHIRIDSEWLVIRLDDKGVVSEAKIARD